MAIYRRGNIWWYSFEFQGRRIQESSGFKNKKRVIDAESIRRTKLLERRVGISQAKLAPKFEEQVENFWNGQNSSIDRKHANCTERIATLCFVSSGDAGWTRSRRAWLRTSN